MPNTVESIEKRQKLPIQTQSQMISDERKIITLMKTLDDEEHEIAGYIASGANTIRHAIENTKAVQELINYGTKTAKIIVQMWEKNQSQNNMSDITICSFAYILERLEYSPAIPILVNSLKQSLQKTTTFWAPHLVTHAIKVLTGQPNRDDIYFSYDGFWMKSQGCNFLLFALSQFSIFRLWIFRDNPIKSSNSFVVFFIGYQLGSRIID